MGHSPVVSHIAVVSHSGAKLPVANAKALPNSEAGGNFADALASQVSPQVTAGGGAPEALAAAQRAAQQAETPVIDLGAQKANEQAAQQLAEVLATLPLPHLPLAQAVETALAAGETLKADPRLLLNTDLASSAEDADALLADASDLSLLAGASKLDILSTAAAKTGVDPAIIAVSEKDLPSRLALHLDVPDAKLLTQAPLPFQLTTRIEAASEKSAAAVPVSLPVDVKVGSPGWDTAFSQRVAWAATNQHQVAELRLNPPNLGPIEIRITISNDQATAAFVSQHASVRDSIEAALPKLREMLGESGLTLGNVNVSSQSFQQQQQQQQAGNGNASAKQGPDLPDSVLNSDLPLQNVAAIALGRHGLVDIFA